MDDLLSHAETECRRHGLLVSAGNISVVRQYLVETPEQPAKTVKRRRKVVEQPQSESLALD